MIAEPWPPDELPPPPDAAPVGEVVDLFAESAPAGNTPMLAAALEIARLGFPVIPLHTPVNGACDCHGAIALHREAPAFMIACGRDQPTRPGQALVGHVAEANIGLVIRPGRRPRLRHGGGERVSTGACPDGDLPHRRGWHFRSGRTGRSPRGRRPAHLDLRGPGCYIVAPPPARLRGTYTWRVGLDRSPTRRRGLPSGAGPGVHDHGGGAPPSPTSSRRRAERHPR